MAMQYEITYGNQCPKFPEIKKTNKGICSTCPYRYHAYHYFAWCSDVKRTTGETLLDSKEFKEEDKRYDREQAEKEYRDCATRIKGLLKIYPDLINIEI